MPMLVITILAFVLYFFSTLTIDSFQMIDRTVRERLIIKTSTSLYQYYNAVASYANNNSNFYGYLAVSTLKSDGYLPIYWQNYAGWGNQLSACIADGTNKKDIYIFASEGNKPIRTDILLEKLGFGGWYHNAGSYYYFGISGPLSSSDHGCVAPDNVQFGLSGFMMKSS